MLKKIFLAFFIMLFATTAGAIWLGKYAAEEWLVSTINQEGRRSGVSVTDVNVGFSGLTTPLLSNALQPIENLTIRPVWGDFLRRRVSLIVSGGVAGGQVQVVATNLSTVDEGTLQATIQEVQLGQMARLQGMGVTAGTVNGSCQLALQGGSGASGTGRITIANGEKPSATFLPGMLIGRSSGVQVPPFSALNGIIDLTVTPQQVTVHTDQLSSSLFAITGSLTFMNPNYGRKAPPEGALRVQLTPEGQRSLPPLLELLFDRPIDPAIRSYTVASQGGRLQLLPG